MVAFDFDERDPAVMAFLKQAVEGAQAEWPALRHLRPGAVRLPGDGRVSGRVRDRLDQRHAGRAVAHDPHRARGRGPAGPAGSAGSATSRRNLRSERARTQSKLARICQMKREIGVVLPRSAIGLTPSDSTARLAAQCEASRGFRLSSLPPQDRGHAQRAHPGEDQCAGGHGAMILLSEVKPSLANQSLRRLGRAATRMRRSGTRGPRVPATGLGSPAKGG